MKLALRFGILLGFWGVAASAEVRVTDDLGRTIRLDQPAQRIVALAPSATELLFAVGAGDRVVAVVDYSDFPAAAASIRRVGSSHSLDLEAIVAANPDLVLAWASGNPPRQVERLREIGIKVFTLEVRALEDIPTAVERIGKLTGTEGKANLVARNLRDRAERLQSRAGPAVPARVFYQLLDDNLMTVNGAHIISDILRRCGGSNVFADMPLLVARVDMEAVFVARPEVILGGGEQALWRRWLTRWQQRPDLPAVKNGRLFFIEGDLIHRPGPRIVDAAERVCAQLDAATPH